MRSLPAPPLRIRYYDSLRRRVPDAIDPPGPSTPRDAFHRGVRNPGSWCPWKESGRTRSARCETRAGAGRRRPPSDRRRNEWASSATCAALRSCAGVMRSIPIAKNTPAATEFAAFKLKSPMRGGCSLPCNASSKPAGRTRMAQSKLSRKFRIRDSPGFMTRGLATRATMPRAFTRSMEGRKP